MHFLGKIKFFGETLSRELLQLDLDRSVNEMSTYLKKTKLKRKMERNLEGVPFFKKMAEKGWREEGERFVPDEYKVWMEGWREEGRREGGREEDKKEGSREEGGGERWKKSDF